MESERGVVSVTKKKWLILLLTVLLTVGVALFVFWDKIAVYIAPKAVLSEALADAVEDLQYHYSRSPVSMIAKHVDPEGRYTVDMELHTENELAGEIVYEMTAQADTLTNQLFAEGTAGTGEKELDLSLYMDKEFMAISSDDLLNGAYYGIFYETFPEDIRGIPLLSILIGEDILTEWDANVAEIQAMMGRSYRLPQIPEISEQDIQKALTSVLLLPSHVKRAEVSVWGVTGTGHSITYSAEGEKVGEVLGYLMDTGDGSDPSVTVTFYLYDNTLIMAELQGEAGGNQIRYSLELMCEASDTRVFRAAYTENGEEKGFCLRHTANMSGGNLDESWTLYPDFEGAGKETALYYRWDPSLGNLVITEDQETIAVNLMETDNGLRIQTNQFEQLMAYVTGQEIEDDAEPAACTMTLQAGAEIAAPEYKNLDAWSLDDLLVLLGGIGSLIGLSLA